MKKIIYSLLSLFVLGQTAKAAGTYMSTNGYQSPQKYYNNGGETSSGYYQPQYRGASGYSVAQNVYQYPNKPESSQQSASPDKNGFYVGGGISHQYAEWKFDMNDAGSILDYNDVVWNILDLNGGYNFGNFAVDAGFSYGLQSGTAKMTDDDITSGGLDTVLYGTYIGNQKVMSIGESKGGNLMDFHVGFGMKDFFQLGSTKITPSLGYRTFDYKLTTSNNNGLSVATYWCDDTGYCPALIWYDDGNGATLGTPTATGGYYWWIISGTPTVSNGDSYSFKQAGKTHVYNVSWSGPYVALDLDSEISKTNFVNARLEFGLPSYSSTGDQPYRVDWEHPTSVEDKKGVFGATHLGLLANWTNMVSDNWGISFGLTYDYYNVDGADATTHLNGDYYNGILTDIWNANATSKGWTKEADMYANDQTAAAILDIYTSCGNSWKCTTKKEVNSFYQSMGVRIGVSGKF